MTQPPAKDEDTRTNAMALEILKVLKDPGGNCNPAAVAMFIAKLTESMLQARQELEALAGARAAGLHVSPAGDIVGQGATVYLRTADGRIRHGTLMVTPQMLAAAEAWPECGKAGQ